MNRGPDSARVRLLGAAAVTAVAAVGSFVWAPPSPASAAGQVGPTGSISQPAANGANFAVSPVGFAGHFDAPNPTGTSAGVIDDISLTVTLATKTGPVGRADFPGCNCPSQQFTWAFDPTSNGRYTLSAVGTGEDEPPDGTGTTSTTVTRTFLVSIPPQTPTNLAAVADDATRTVKLSWAANPEPDIFGYLIQRQAPGAGFAQLAAVGPTTTYTDAQVASLPPGSYSYDLIAVRHSGDGQGYVESSPSSAATASVTGPPVTTTTAPAGGTGAPGGSPSTTAGPGPAPLAPAPALPAPTRADAGNFSQLQAQARASSVTTEPPDPGFNPQLPFATPKTTTQIVNVPDAAQLASGATLGGDSSERHRLTYEYVAGGLLLFVLAMHALHLKHQVDQAVALEPIEVRLASADDPAERLLGVGSHREVADPF